MLKNGSSQTVAEWCESQGIAVVHFAAVKLVQDKMSVADAAAQYNCMTAGW